MKRLITIFFVLLAFSAYSQFGFYGLNRNYIELPTVTLASATNGVSWCVLNAYGEVTADGGAAVTERGFVLSIYTNPTISDIKVVLGSGTGTFNTVTYTSLDWGTHYYIRAYAINSKGVAYSSELNFLTKTIPSLTSTEGSITGTSAIISGSLTTNGNYLTDIAVDYGYTFGVWIGTVSQGSTTSPYSIPLTGLNPSTLYHYRVRGVDPNCNDAQAVGSFTTTSGCTTLPDVFSLGFPGGNTSTSIFVRTNVSSDCPITSRKIYYSTTLPVNETSASFPQANATGLITTEVTGLSPNTGYYFACYVYNDFGLDYIVNSAFKVYTLP